METTSSELLSKIKDILLKKAEGYFYDEKIEEYQQTEDDDKKDKNTSKSVSEQLKLNLDDLNSELISKPTNPKRAKRKKMELIKKKITTHHIPPDLGAIKMLLELFASSNDDNLSSLSQEELLELKDELIKKLKKY